MGRALRRGKFLQEERRKWGKACGVEVEVASVLDGTIKSSWSLQPSRLFYMENRERDKVEWDNWQEISYLNNREINFLDYAYVLLVISY